MSKEILISVVMPVYNGEKYLAEAIESILTQTIEDFEFIIINDGSTDDSLGIINQYDDDRIILINRENRGLIYSLNEGISLVKGKYIARMDADDISLDTRFEKQVALMEKDTLDICGSHYFEINENNRFMTCFIAPLSQQSFLYYMSNTTPFAHPSVMIRKSFIADNDLSYGLSEFRDAEDYGLWNLFWIKGARFGNVDDFLFKYRNFSTSLSKQNKGNILKDANEISKKFVLSEREKIISNLKTLDCLAVSKLEREYIVMTIFKLIRYDFSFKYLKLLRSCDKRSIVCGFFKFIKRLS